MILFAFSSTRLDSTMPASSMVSTNIRPWAASAVVCRRSCRSVATAAVNVTDTRGKNAGPLPSACAATSDSGPCHCASRSPGPVSTGCAGVPDRMAAKAAPGARSIAAGLGMCPGAAGT